jgi:hypothetical protein
MNNQAINLYFYVVRVIELRSNGPARYFPKINNNHKKKLVRSFTGARYEALNVLFGQKTNIHIRVSIKERQDILLLGDSLRCRSFKGISICSPSFTVYICCYMAILTKIMAGRNRILCNLSDQVG